MSNQNLLLSFLFIPFSLFTACAQEAAESNLKKTPTEAEQKSPPKNIKLHPYGGWYCPDNLRGFPPVNAMDLNTIPVITSRMPTQKETQTETSVMYFDPEEFPTAKPLDIVLPQLARFYCQQTQQMEHVIVIQAVEVDKDTVVGFRFLNGGNGTSWYNEVEFLSPKEVSALGATPFVFIDTVINATKEKIWSVVASSAYGKNLGKRFNEEEFFQAEWTKNSRVKLKSTAPNQSANGYIMSLFGNLYLQINYNYNGRTSVEKLLVIQQEDGTCHVQFVFGPYLLDNGNEQAFWPFWLSEIKSISEAQ